MADEPNKPGSTNDNISPGDAPPPSDTPGEGKPHPDVPTEPGTDTENQPS